MRKRIFTTQIGIPVSEEFRANLVKVCNDLEISVAEYIRQAIQMRLERDNCISTDTISNMEE